MSISAKPFVKGFKFRIYPSTHQRIYLAKVFGACRFVFNKALYETSLQYKQSQKSKNIAKPKLSAFDLFALLPTWKRQEETSWLSEAPAQVLQASLANLSDSYKTFFRNKYGYPTFKKKQGRQSATYSNQIYRLTDQGLILAKCDEIFKIKFTRPLPSTNLKACTVSMTPTGKYYVSFLCEYIPEKTSGTGFLGIDAGITDLATMSNGLLLLNPRHFVTKQHRLKILQRRLSKKQKGSRNRNKARLKVARLHEAIANQRSDYMHKFTTRIIRENQAVAIERLQVRNMVKNRRLSKHIADAAWGEMRRQLIYKAVASQHCMLVLADPYYPSTQLCHCCQMRPSVKIALGVKEWRCEHCGKLHSRDHNASLNLEILARSHHYQQKTLDSSALIVLAKPFVPLIQTTAAHAGSQACGEDRAVMRLDEAGSPKLGQWDILVDL